MKLSDVSLRIQQGAFISRIVDISTQDKNEKRIFKYFTMADLIAKIEQSVFQEEKEAIVQVKENVNLPLTKENMVLVGLTLTKACVITKEDEGKVIPSNFCYIEVNPALIDPYYLMWVINYSRETSKQMAIAKQGIGLLALSINMLRDFRIDLHDKEKQKKIGDLYKLILRRRANFQKTILLQDKILENIK